ncbi:hypothetical protein EXU57_05490 [Segetibacter sp. 3557_3]|uniref:hypothetical protein n=1 Tax=Segetibacter sp. 3557_3 TaxID=2547429 RepID=UPI0010592129|nr:hypothetical protein [Segetibacter sp. 3557_3]TDH27920.1 hypothetical protein EXU57_05490 [Segetibacter sp. 3557_3]
MKLLFTICLVYFVNTSFSQELYVFSEPASNMPARSISFKGTARFPYNKMTNTYRQRYMPEIMFGINKNWMVHFSGSFSDFHFKNIRYDGARLYAKYRFLSNDEVHRHFRMAAFADAAFTRNPYTYQEVNLEGDNDGAQLGFIATQLVNKTAVSLTAAYTRVFAQKTGHQDHRDRSLHMINYTLSAGQLLLPKEYTDYRQTNLNLYVELMGSKALDSHHYGVDLAPAVQVIFNSNTKVNLGYRFQLKSNMTRVGENMVQIAIERTLLNAWK